MANRDKGRKNWGRFSQEPASLQQFPLDKPIKLTSTKQANLKQIFLDNVLCIFTDNIQNFKLEKEKSVGMRGGCNRAPQPLYTPGSGPLRKSEKFADDIDHENNSQIKGKSTSVQHRLKQHNSNKCIQMRYSLPPLHGENLNEKLNDMHINLKNDNSDHVQETFKSNYGGDPRRKSRKPEQQLYVPKKVKEAMAEQDVPNRFDRDHEREESEDREDRDDRDDHGDHGNHGDHGDHGDRNDRDDRGDRNDRDDHDSHPSGGFKIPRHHNRSDGCSGRNERNKRFLGNRRNYTNENEESWRSESLFSNTNFNNRRDNPREVRQGSEPLYVTPNNPSDFSRTRDTRSVEPAGYPDKFQGKPPSGKKSVANKLECLPPRFQKKYCLDNGLALPTTSLGSTVEESWNGTTGSPVYYPPEIQHSQTMQNLPISGPIPPQPNWSNTVPVRSRGRGRLRPEEMEGPTNTFRPVTPDQSSAPSSRSHTPSQEYTNRSYDRRSSNSTMYTSMESLSRADSVMLTPSMSTLSSLNRSQISSEERHSASSPTPSQHRTYNTQRVNNSNERKSMEKHRSQQVLSPSKSESFSPPPDRSSEHTLDWSEEVELNEKLEAQHLSRSSSMQSLRESVSLSGSQSKREGNKRGRRKHDKKSTADCNNSSDKTLANSRDCQNNEQNRENDNFNNNQKNSHNYKRYDHRKHRNIIPGSRESSKDRNYRSSSRHYEELHRPRPADRHLDENWRTGRKMSTCDSDEGKQTPKVSPHPIPTTPLSNTNSNLTIRQASPTGYTNTQPPGVLVLPETNQSPPNHTVSRQQGSQQQRTLFDPNNPNKPIVVTSPGSRVVSQRENQISQTTSIPVFQSHTGIAPYNNFHAAPLDGISSPYMIDQFGNMKPSWYDPYSDSFRSAKNPCLLLDIGRADLELQWMLSSGGFTTNWERVSYIRCFLQDSLLTLLKTDIKFCQAENAEQHFWKILFYNMIEMLRKGMSKENSESKEYYKKTMLSIIDEGTIYLENLITVLENTYDFKVQTFLASSTLPKGLGILGLALVSAQKIFLFLGDLARYREQANETTNYGKSRQWYSKAQQINPKNGRPYNQLALLAHYAKRKLDAVYYYMRSLMASNPFHSARESLLALFDENRKKYESTERKRKEEREWKERARMKEKEGANNVGGGLRREIWFHPGGRRVRRTTTAASTTDPRLAQSDLEELAQLTSVEVNKRFVTSYLHVHGKLITKIG
ncbi:hypothetical protein M0802_004184 [Mischocyttarus mexicanus]|nr:hypothetical protein M0802_004184 [Mischocyttarus mexicanus]